MNKKIFTSIAAVSVASVASFSTINSASAAALTGDFNLVGVGPTTADLYFNPVAGFNQVDFIDADGSDPGRAQLSVQNGDFAPFLSAYLKDIPSVPSASYPAASNPFMDLETSLSLPSGGSGDSLNVFNLTNVGNFSIFPSTSNLVQIGLTVFGDFIAADGSSTAGEGIFTFQVAKLGAATEVAQWQAGAKAKISTSFSGAVFATTKAVPESSSLLGLAALSVVGAVAAVRNTKKLEM